MKPTPLAHLTSLLGTQCQSPALVSGIAIDSRLVKRGDLFFALTGERSDGHAFLADVAGKGAVGAVVRQDYSGEAHGLQLVRVPAVLPALQEMARRTLRRRKTQVIAITGSMGKTTTKEFTHSLLKPCYKVSKSPFSYNSKATLPLSILEADEEDDWLILEMGMSEKGEIAHLVSIAPPVIACLTTVTLQHTTGFPEGLIGIAKEKGAIFSHEKTTLGLLCNETPYFEEIVRLGSCRKETFSLRTPEATLFGTLVQEGISVQGHTIPLKLPLTPHYQNFLAALSIAKALQVPWESIMETALTLRLPPMRFEIVEKQGIVFVNDAYNANPEAMQSALEHLPIPRTRGKTIAVFAEMNGLGVFTEEGHTQVAKKALVHADLLLCLGNNCLIMKKIWEEAQRKIFHFEDKGALAQALKEVAEPGDVVLLKGARAWALDELLNYF